MRKILLVNDDYNETVATESLFKRLGLDVMTVGKDFLVNDALIRFQAELAIINAKSRAVDGFKLAPKLKKAYPQLRIVLAFSPGVSMTVPAEIKNMIDGVLEQNTQPQAAIRLVAQVLNLDPAPLIAKYEKLFAARGQSAEDSRMIGNNGTDTRDTSSVMVSGGLPKAASAGAPRGWDPQANPGKAAQARTERSNRYDKFLQETAEVDSDPVDKTIPREKLAEAGRKLAKASEGEQEKLEKIGVEKRAFVKALFHDEKAPKKKI